MRAAEGGTRERRALTESLVRSFAFASRYFPSNINVIMTLAVS